MNDDRRSQPLRAFRRTVLASLALAVGIAACGWDPSHPFDREAPQVREALHHYEAGAPDAASALLTDYLTTGACQEGNIGVPGRLRERPNGTFDLGLSMFEIAEAFGRRFGDEDDDAGAADPNAKGLRAGQVECALRVVRAIAEDLQQAGSLRARARYLEGNLLFLTSAYEDAVKAYDKALEIVPAMGDAGPIGTRDSGVAYAIDVVGRDAAWNRAVALRRIEENKKKDAGNDAQPNDGGGEGGSGDGGQQDPDKKDPDKNDPNKNDPDKNDEKDAGKDAGKPNPEDAGGDAGGNDNKSQPPPKPDPKDDGDAGAPPPPSRQNQDERILDQLENAPTVQQEAAKKHARTRKVRGMSDK